MLLRPSPRRNPRRKQISAVNNLKQIGLGRAIYAQLTTTGGLPSSSTKCAQLGTDKLLDRSREWPAVRLSRRRKTENDAAAICSLPGRLWAARGPFRDGSVAN